MHGTMNIKKIQTNSALYAPNRFTPGKELRDWLVTGVGVDISKNKKNLSPTSEFEICALQPVACSPFELRRVHRKTSQLLFVLKHSAKSTPLYCVALPHKVVWNCLRNMRLPNAHIQRGEFPTKCLHLFHTSPLHATWPIHIIRLELIT